MGNNRTLAVKNSQNSHFSHVIFLHDQLDKLDQVPLQVCQDCQLCHIFFCTDLFDRFLFKRSFRSIRSCHFFTPCIYYTSFLYSLFLFFIVKRNKSHKGPDERERYIFLIYSLIIRYPLPVSSRSRVSIAPHLKCGKIDGFGKKGVLRHSFCINRLRMSKKSSTFVAGFCARTYLYARTHI